MAPGESVRHNGDMNMLPDIDLLDCVPTEENSRKWDEFLRTAFKLATIVFGQEGAAEKFRAVTKKTRGPKKGIMSEADLLFVYDNRHLIFAEGAKVGGPKDVAYWLHLVRPNGPLVEYFPTGWRETPLGKPAAEGKGEGQDEGEGAILKRLRRALDERKKADAERAKANAEMVRRSERLAHYRQNPVTSILSEDI
jgi:hypothetical protein